MQDTDLFQMALGLMHPWIVEQCEFDPQKKRLDIHITFERGGRFPCPECAGPDCKVHDTVDKRWRHLNFFEHVTYLHVRTPRVKCPKCGVRRVPVPWAREGSGFTLLFEAFLLVLAKEMPVNAVARIVGEHDTRIWRILRHYVELFHVHDLFSATAAVEVAVPDSLRSQGLSLPHLLPAITIPFHINPSFRSSRSLPSFRRFRQRRQPRSACTS